MARPLNPAGTKPLAARRMKKPPRRRYGGVAKRLSQGEARETLANEQLRRTGQAKSHEGQMCWKTLRVTKPDDLLSREIAADVFDEAIDGELLTQFVSQPALQALFIVCDVADAVVVGQIKVQIVHSVDQPTSLYIDNLGVAPTHQRRGVASALIEAAKQWGREARAQSIWVATELDNSAARALYEASGLTEQTISYFEGEL